jgi:hypothetical protein
MIRSISSSGPPEAASRLREVFELFEAIDFFDPLIDYETKVKKNIVSRVLREYTSTS